MNELISVIIPMYKVENYLICCLESVINQTYKNLEIILVDDGSPDLCGKIADDYAKKDKRIKVIHKENGGLSDARNVAIDIASGKYILFIDSDDFIPNYAINEMYKSLIDNRADICEGDMSITYNHSDNLTLSEYECTVYNKIDALENLMYLNNFKNSAWCKLYKREVIGDIRFPKGKNYEDLATTYKFFSNANKVVKINLRVYFYYQNRNGIMRSKYKSNRLIAIDFAKEELDFCKKKFNCIVPAAKYRLAYECIKVLNDMPFFCNDSKEVIKTLKKYRNDVLNDDKLSLKKKSVFYSSYLGKLGIKLLFLFK